MHTALPLDVRNVLGLQLEPSLWGDDVGVHPIGFLVQQTTTRGPLKEHLGRVHGIGVVVVASSEVTHVVGHDDTSTCGRTDVQLERLLHLLYLLFPFLGGLAVGVIEQIVEIPPLGLAVFLEQGHGP